MARKATIKVGALSNDEKAKILYAIKESGDNQITYETLAGPMRRNIETIENFVKETRKLFVQEEEIKQVEVNILSPEVIKRVTYQLIGAGQTKATATAKIKQVLSRLTEEEQKKVNEAILYALCLRLTNPGDLMQNSSAGGNSGVTIMNQGASERSDDMRRKESPKLEGIYPIHTDD